MLLGQQSLKQLNKLSYLRHLPGIVGSVLLAVSRAIGETMIVVMAAGLAANLNNKSLRVYHYNYNTNCYDSWLEIKNLIVQKLNQLLLWD